jgi:glucokinase
MEERLAFGVDIGATNSRVVLANVKGQFLAKLSERTDIKNGPLGISNQIIRLIRSIKIKNSQLRKIEGVGIGSAGPLQLKRGGLVHPSNIPYDFVPLVEPIEKKFGFKTLLLNDGSAAVMGEHFYGAGQGINNLAYITISTGIGGGVYVDGHLLLGKDGNASEIGHFTIDYAGCLTCGCGGKGHWEAYCSGMGIPHYVNLILKDKSQELESSNLLQFFQRNGGRPSARNLYASARTGDSLALSIVEMIGRLNAIGFACVNDAYDPSLITVGGSITLNNSELIVEPIKKYINRYTINRAPEIKITPLGGDVVIFGALAKIFHQPTI